MNLLDTPKLGFGLMRLPAMPGDPDAIDIEQTKKMVDLFMQAGLTYFDTAFVYGKDGASEKAAKEELEFTNTTEAASYVGTLIGKRALEAGITEVVFDRGGYLYHGKVKALAEAAREAGLKF